LLAALNLIYVRTPSFFLLWCRLSYEASKGARDLKCSGLEASVWLDWDMHAIATFHFSGCS